MYRSLYEMAHRACFQNCNNRLLQGLWFVFHVSKTLPPIFYKGIVFTILMCQGLAAASSKAWICWRPATTKHQQTFAATDSCPEDCVERFLCSWQSRKPGLHVRRNMVIAGEEGRFALKQTWNGGWSDVWKWMSILFQCTCTTWDSYLEFLLSFEKIIGGPGQIEPTKKINRRN